MNPRPPHRLRGRRAALALTIAGSDSGGGAGLQADLKTFAALGVHGTCVVTCVTAQNPCSVRSVRACATTLVEAQLTALLDELPPAAAKTGMLLAPDIIHAVVRLLAGRRFPLVVDPVMVATSGAVLLRPSAVRALRDQLLPLATLATPNLDEAGILVGTRLETPEDLRAAAREIHRQSGCAVLVKGGHLPACREAVDIFYDGRRELLLSAPFIRHVSTHGTGCTYSAAITGWLARGLPLPAAVRAAKAFVTQAIAASVRIGRHQALNPLARRAPDLTKSAIP
ncbi:MAG TPA: bifunctional hydroxymethylpyrimidine kinase/phosphomethylpyrimidine kinase [Verrucomicrobiota bacterium]|nr:bifunctional hydroxymethylpyrimidine kinase/phosphomethylpyrimidine kinase [Verrucomicrobiota bacterium]HNU51759.1 bifunctional hydroxymethylpyrimidine kinase/phosphomethylpyrimidine kinase [Verrucomicrobiota bacterium]